MNIIIKRKDFRKVPKEFAWLVFAPACGAVLFGDPFMVTGMYTDAGETIRKIAKKPGIPVGTVYKYVNTEYDYKKGQVVYFAFYKHSWWGYPIDKKEIKKATKDLLKTLRSFEKQRKEENVSCVLPRNQTDWALPIIRAFFHDKKINLLVTYL